MLPGLNKFAMGDEFVALVLVFVVTLVIIGIVVGSVIVGKRGIDWG